MFLDESGVRMDLTRTHGRAPRGRRIGQPVPHARWATVTVVSAMGLRGVAASLASEGVCDGAASAAFPERVLAPALRPADVVVLYYLGAYKDAAAARAVEYAGAKLRFPTPYSSNPIERMWSKAKGRLPSAAARTPEASHAALGPALAAIPPADCRAWLRGCGYYTSV